MIYMYGVLCMCKFAQLPADPCPTGDPSFASTAADLVKIQISNELTGRRSKHRVNENIWVFEIQFTNTLLTYWVSRVCTGSHFGIIQSYHYWHRTATLALHQLQLFTSTRVKRGTLDRLGVSFQA